MIDVKNEMCRVMAEAYKRNWITTRDGNVSHRSGDNFAITPSGFKKNKLSFGDINFGKYNGNLITFTTNTTPSIEFDMHKKLQDTHQGELSVLHLHPTYSIAAMYKEVDLMWLAGQFPELSRYTDVAGQIDYYPPGSSQLAEDTFLLMTNGDDIVYDVVGQKNHGVCSVGKTPWEAFEHIERLEHICKIYLTSGV